MSDKLKDKIISYYRKYYRDELGLKDWERRIVDRVDEEVLERKRIKRKEEVYNFQLSGKSHFICGAGTGGLAVVLKNDYASEVFGIEPDPDAFDIIMDKCSEFNIPCQNFRQEFGEKISFPDDNFDFVHCFTVLEHVEDVERCIKEMLRICKPNGKIFLNTPNYRFPYEGHYKIFFPTFLPRIFGYLYLLLLRRPIKFLKTINFIDEKKLNKYLIREKSVVWMRVYESAERGKDKGYFGWLINYLKFSRFIYPNQELIIIKGK